MIVRTGSLASAAERLGMSPSAASRMIAVLERELNLTLFSRQNRKLDLTDHGRDFMRRSQHILEGVERLTEIAAQVRSTEAEPLRLVSTVPLAKSLLNPVLARWTAEARDTTIVLDIETRFDLESKVAAREYNLGIVSLPVENAIVDLDIQPLARARHEIAMAPGHPLAASDEVSMSDLAESGFVALRPGQRWRQRLDALAAANSFAPRILSETGSTTVALDMVRRGLGIVLVDRMIAGLEHDATIVLRPLKPEIWTEYCLIMGQERASAMTKAFSQVLRDWLQERCSENAELAASLKLAEPSTPDGRLSRRALASRAN
jgi:DNA-binding transcriptional LysR family regulator